MTRNLILLLVLFTTCIAHANEQFTFETKVAALVKVWGFMKYFHPSVTHGNINWDSVFITQLDKIDAAESKEDFNNSIEIWVKSLPIGFAEKGGLVDSIYLNFTLRNIMDTALFTSKNIEFFKNLVDCKIRGNNRFVNFDNAIAVPQFINEETYEDYLYPTTGFRLLALARYWNIVEYYYPYKLLLDKDWNTVLMEQIPNFVNCKDASGYYFTLMRLFKQCNDTHTEMIFNTKNYTPFGNLYMQYSFNIIDEKVYVGDDYYNNDSLAKIDGIRTGDRLLKIDGAPVDSLIVAYKRLASGSNNAAIRRTAAYLLTRGLGDVVEVAIERKGQKQQVKVHRYSRDFLSSFFGSKASTKSWLKIDEKVGYINLKYVDDEIFKIAMKNLKKSKCIVFDLRGLNKNLSRNSIAKYLSTNYNPFCNYYVPAQDLPGSFILLDSMKIGIKQKAFYKGKIIVLVNEYTQSAAEYFAMMFKTFPYVTIIGSTTAGTDGDVRRINLPGGYVALMTGGGVYYPDNKPSQRIGITPDIEVIPSIDGIKNDKDEILDYALKLAKSYD